MRKNSAIILCLLQITIMLTNLTQIPDWVTNSGVKLLSYIPWIALTFLLLGVSKGKLVIGSQRYLYILVIGILFVCAILEILGSNGFGVALLRPMLICMFIYTISMNLAQYINFSDLNHLLVTYILSAIIVAVFVYRTILANGFSWTSRVYAYDAKNSVAQIILTAVFFLIYLNGRKSRIWDIFIGIVTSVLIVELFMLKSRASLLGLAIIFISVLVGKIYNKFTKRLVTIVVSIFFLFFIFEPEFRTFFIESIVFAGRDSSNLNSISSGRMDMLIAFPQTFADKPILGYGRYYVECMQLDALIETGILGGVLFNVMAIAPIVYAIKSYKYYKQPIDYLLMIVGVCYYVNGFFEQLAPFGPGVKCYFLWLLFGFSVTWRKRNIYENTLDYKYANNI